MHTHTQDKTAIQKWVFVMIIKQTLDQHCSHGYYNIASET